jgi:acetoacetate decarboxylase
VQDASRGEEVMSEAAKPESEAYIWRNARVLAVEVPVARETAVSWLPAPLEPAEPPAASIFIADYPETTVGLVYREAGILLHARDGAGAARHCSWMVVDDDAALILGREMLGFPKKMAEISLVESGSGVVGSVRRKGTEIMRIEASLGERESEPGPFLATRVVNAIGTPITGTKLLDLPPTGEAIHSSRRGEGKLTLTSSERDALGDLRVPPDCPAHYMTVSFGVQTDPESVIGPDRLISDVDATWVQRMTVLRQW